MFAMFLGIAAVIAVFGLVADPIIVSEQPALMEGIIPKDAYDPFRNQITRLLVAQSDTLGWARVVSISLALWSSPAGVAALMVWCSLSRPIRSRTNAAPLSYRTKR